MEMMDVFRLIQGEALEPAAEDEAVRMLADKAPGEMPQLLQRLVHQRRKLASDCAKARTGEARAAKEAARLQGLLDAIGGPPLQAGVVLRSRDDGRLEVAAAGRRQILGALPDVVATPLRTGDEVWLDPNRAVVVARGEPGSGLGRIGTVSERLGDRVVVTGEADEPTVVLCDPALAAGLTAGDRVLYAGEFPCVLERLPRRRSPAHWLERPPDVHFEDVCGLDGIVDDVRVELDLQLFHPDLVSTWGLSPVRGMTLVGPPGVGKTLFAKAIARFVADVASDTRFLNVKPGSLRGPFYGQAESRIHELFAAVREAPGLVVLYFDELDHFGARSQGPGRDVDDRVMGTLLEELDGVQGRRNVFVIGSTNRIDLVDDALIRAGRFGDRVIEIPRPDREGTRAILARHLHAGLPWDGDGPPDELAADAVSSATGYLHAPRSGAGAVLRLTFSDGSQQEVHPRQVVSGALLASCAEAAKQRAARRQLEGGRGLRGDDVTSALDRALLAEARRLSRVHVARRALDLPRAQEIVRVEVPIERCIGSHARLWAA